jgi:hypothetical protein
MKTFALVAIPFAVGATLAANPAFARDQRGRVATPVSSSDPVEACIQRQLRLFSNVKGGFPRSAAATYCNGRGRRNRVAD